MRRTIHLRKNNYVIQYDMRVSIQNFLAESVLSFNSPVRPLVFPFSAYQVYVTLKSRILFCIFVISRAFLGATKNCHDLQIQFSSSVISQKSKVHQEASKDLYIKGRKALAQCVTVVTWKLHKLCHHPEGQ